MTIGGTILQNKLRQLLPSAIKSSIPGVDNIAYVVVPLIRDMPQPEKDVARHAFATSLAVVWRVLIALAGVGLLASLPMRGLPLHTTKDENWAMKEAAQKSSEE